MPRQARLRSPSKIYHIMMRGNEKKKIFFDDEDRNRFLSTLLLKVVKKKCSVYAYCLMDNHIHLILNEHEEEISRVIKSLNISYAYYFNKKYQRVGHLFQDRFKSEAIDSDGYLLSAVRYIHKNPVSAAIVKKEIDYNWSSYRIYIKGNDLKNLVDRDFLLEMFSKDKNKAIKLFEDFSKMGNDVNLAETAGYTEALKKSNEIRSKLEAQEQIEKLLKNAGLNLDDLKNKQNFETRNQLIKMLLKDSILSIREIADLLTINRGSVQRIHEKIGNRVKEPSPDTVPRCVKI